MSGKSKRDLSGNIYGYLTVLRRSSDKGNGKKPVIKYICRCVCGKEFDVKSDSLLSGHTVSCGCIKIKHGYANKERLYNIWKCMRQRCNNPKNPSYPRYGGKGVTICDEWNDYQGFRNWALSNGYDDTLSIDRINPDGNYCPKNCRWADDKTQMNNQTRNHFIEYKGQRYTMAQLADKLHLSYAAIQHRIERGWDIERIIKQEQRRW